MAAHFDLASGSDRPHGAAACEHTHVVLFSRTLDRTSLSASTVRSFWTISEVCWTTKHGTSTARDVTSLCILDGQSQRSVERMMRDARWATGDVRHGWWFSTGSVARLALGGCHRGAAHADRIAKAAPAAHVKTGLGTEEKIPRFIFVTGSLAPAQQADV